MGLGFATLGVSLIKSPLCGRNGVDPCVTSVKSSVHFPPCFADTTDSEIQNSERRHSITLMQTPVDPAPATPDDLGITGGNIIGPHGPAGPLHGFMASFNSSSSADMAEIPVSDVL